MGFLPAASVPDSDYLLRRSTVESAMAAKARSASAAAAHHRIASCYLGKLFGGPGEAPAENAPPLRTRGVGPLRFTDLTAVPDNADLERVLRKIG